MKKEQSWSASSGAKESRGNDELAKLSGQWNIGIKVTITNPYEYSQSPVEVKNKEGVSAEL